MIIYTPIPHLKTIMCTSPKCACQTVERLTLRLFKHPYFKTHQVGGPTKTIPQFKRQQERFSEMLLENKDCSKIITSRNPLQRALSCYNYMILGRHRYTWGSKSGITWFKNTIEKTLNKSLYNISFTEFIDYIYETPDSERDIHFSTQSYMVEDVDFEYVVKLNNFNNDLQRAIDDLSLPLVIPARLQKNQTNYGAFDISQLTKDVLEKIYDIYDLDFKKFGHKKLTVSQIKDYIKKKSFRGPLHQPPVSGARRKWKTNQ